MYMYELSAVILIFAWSEGSSFSCYNCTGVTSPGNCSDVIQCQGNEVCIARRYTEPGSEPGSDVVYDLGCSTRTQHTCPRWTRSLRAGNGHYQIEFWSSCCHGNLCNARFDDKGNLKDEHPLECGNCSAISDPSMCNTTTLCNNGDTCEAVRMQPTKRRVVCRGCCDDVPMCNSKICSLTAMKTTTIATTTSVAPLLDPFKNVLFVVTPEQQTVEYKGATQIICKLEGVTNTTPKLVWFHVTSDGSHKRINKGSGNRLVLTIPEVDRSSSGTYVCKAYRGSRWAKAEARVDLADFVAITVPPYSLAVKPGVAVNDQSITIAAGSDVKLPCEADGIPPPYISWTIQKRGQSTMTVGAGNPRYNAPMPILNMQTKYQGIYTCIASNSQGKAEEAVLVRIGS